jgi:hypothetical protein
VFAENGLVAYKNGTEVGKEVSCIPHYFKSIINEDTNKLIHIASPQSEDGIGRKPPHKVINRLI